MGPGLPVTRKSTGWILEFPQGKPDVGLLRQLFGMFRGPRHSTVKGVAAKTEGLIAMEFFRVRNFERFQHYTDRRPPWIKLYRDIFDDPKFFKLSDEHRYVLIALFVVASQNENHVLAQRDWLARQCLTTPKQIDKALPALLSLGWIESSDGPEAESGWASRYVSAAQRERIFERDGRACVLCKSEQNLEVDHVISISKGGTGEDNNLQILCRTCNRKKRSRLSRAEQPSLDRSSADSEQKQVAETETETDIQRQKTETEREPRKRGKTRAPDSLNLTAEMQTFATAHEVFDVEEQTKAMLDHFRAKGEARDDWVATWRNWIRRCVKFSSNGGSYGKSKQDKNIEAAQRLRSRWSAEDGSGVLGGDL